MFDENLPHIIFFPMKTRILDAGTVVVGDLRPSGATTQEVFHRAKLKFQICGLQGALQTALSYFYFGGQRSCLQILSFKN